MVDVEEIKKLKARNFRALDSKDWDLYEAGFATDIVVDLTRAGASGSRGRKAFMAYAKGMTIVQSVHHGHMLEIDPTGPDSARGVLALGDYNIWEDGSQNHGWGHYIETYVKRDDRWQIATMALWYLRVERSFGQAPMIAGPEGRPNLRSAHPAA